MNQNMLSCQIPGKTFALGEYAVLAGGSALIITHHPCFELKLSDNGGNKGSMPNRYSPAGRLWHRHQATLQPYCFECRSPYPHGGLGASSAEFIGLHRFISRINTGEDSGWLEVYQDYKSLTAEQSCPPSGADVVAQSLGDITLFNPLTPNGDAPHASRLSWPFKDLGFTIFHTGHKLATHRHLNQLTHHQPDLVSLCHLVEQGIDAFIQADTEDFIAATSAYHRQLKALNLVADHTLTQLTALQTRPDVLAAKGCGALGADTGLILHHPDQQTAIHRYLAQQDLRIIS